MAEKKPASATAAEEVVMDKRLVDRLVAKGKFTRAEVEKQLESLPDLADKADNIGPMVYPNHG
jgi:hypothetical protein